jgi:hypothetical protein
MFRAKVIDHAHNQEDADCGETDVITQQFDPSHVFGAGCDVGQCGPAAERGCDSKIGE